MQTRTILDGLWFGEGPRWHDDRLWFSDMHGHRVVRTDLDGNSETVLEMGWDEPSGLGWLPDGRLLVVAMSSRKLVRLEPDGSLTEHADLSSIADGDINDMIVAADGTAYVGHMGYRIHEPGAQRRTAETIRVTPDGEVSVAAGGLEAPNGHALTDDGRTLIVAESAAMRLSAFDVAADGSLSNRRVFAELVPEPDTVPVSPPDGICLDAEGAVWYADPIGARVVRVSEGGAVLDQHRFDDVIPVACVLGGAERRSLCVCVAADWRREVVRRSATGRIEVLEVAVAGAGRP